MAPRDETGMRFEQDPDNVPRKYRDMVGWEAYATAMGDLAELQRSRGFDVLMLSLHPQVGGLKDRALTLGGELGFQIVDMGPTLRAYMAKRGIMRYLGSDLSVAEDNGHPSPLGHTLAAEELFARLSALNEALVEGPLPGLPSDE